MVDKLVFADFFIYLRVRNSTSFKYWIQMKWTQPDSSSVNIYLPFIPDDRVQPGSFAFHFCIPLDEKERKKQ